MTTDLNLEEDVLGLREAVKKILTNYIDGIYTVDLDRHELKTYLALVVTKAKEGLVSEVVDEFYKDIEEDDN